MRERKTHSRRHGQQGITLVELMVGLLIGMIIVGAVLYVFFSSRLTYKYNDTMGRIQENGRLAMDLMGQDLRMAGFIGCRRLAAYLPPAATGSIAAQSIYFSNEFNNAISTSVGLSAGELNLADHGFVFSQDLTDQLEGTDSLTVLSGQAEISLAEMMANGISDVVTTSTVPSGPAIISDCRFDTLSLSDSSPTGVPAPAEAFLVNAAGTTIEHGEFLRAYDVDASVTPISSLSYSIRPTERNDVDGNPVLALFRNEDEFIEGARDMCVRYGVAANASNEAVGEYVEASEVDDWKRVISVRIEVLISSVDDGVVDTAASAPTLCDRAPPDDPELDRRMHKVFTTTVGLRNQVRQP